MSRSVPTRALVVLVGLALAAGALFAQEGGLTAKDVIGLKELGFSDREILDEIERTGSRPSFTPEEIETLKNLGAGEALLSVLAPKADVVAQAVSMHQDGHAVDAILEKVLATPRTERAPAQILPAVKAGLPPAVLFALRGRPLTRDDVAALAAKSTSLKTLNLVAGYLGLGFELDDAARTALTQAGVPAAWFVVLGRHQQGGGPSPVEPRHPDPGPGPGPGPGPRPDPAGDRQIPKPDATNDATHYDARPGDWFTYSQSMSMGGQEQSFESTIQVKAVDGNKISQAIVTRTPDGEEYEEEETLTVQPTIREQLAADLASEGKVEIESYQSTPIEYTWQGKKLKARRVEMKFKWSLEDGTAPCQLVLVLSPEIPGMGLLEFVLTTEGFKMERKLTKFGRG